MALKHNGGSYGTRVAISCVAAFLCVGVGLAAFVSRLNNSATRRFESVHNSQQLKAQVDRLGMLHDRIALSDPRDFPELSAELDTSFASLNVTLHDLHEGGFRRETIAEIESHLGEDRRKFGASIANIASAGSAAETLRVEKATHFSLDALVESYISALSEDEKGDLRRVSLLAWLTAPPLSVVLGVIVVCVMRSTRAAAGVASQNQQMVQFEAIVQSSQDVISIVGDDGSFTFVSPASRRVFGFEASTLVGSRVVGLLEPDDVETFVTADQAVRASGEPTTVEVKVVGADGDVRHFEATGSAVQTNWTSGTVWTWRDVHDRRTLEYQLVHQAFHDSLTGLANRALFRDRAEWALMRAVRSASPTSILFFDLDGFKTINDSLGHEAGDDALVAVAERLQECVRPGDTTARFGGDEFAVLLEAASLEQAQLVAQRIRESVRHPIRIKHRGTPTEISLSASIGIALAVPGVEGVEEVMRNADTAMYAAKAGGRDRVEQFEPRMFHEARTRLELHGELQKASAQGQLHVFFQPIVNLAEGEVIAVEALLRWHHPTLGPIGPDRFIPIAEESGLILDIGRWVVGEAAKECARLMAQGRRIRVNVNLSARQLLDPLIVDIVEGELELHKLDPSLLVLEITESVLLSNSDEVTGRLDHLKRLGVRIALDDFGTGYSSLSYLQRLPLDSVKIDKSFVTSTLDPGERGRVFVETIVSLGLSLNLETVAEGVESNHQFERLREIGCVHAQGFYFAPAVPTHEVDAVIDGIHRRFLRTLRPVPPADADIMVG